MARLTRWLQTAALVLACAAGCAAADSGAGWPVRDFQSFTLRAPAGWVSSEGAADSKAGQLQGAGITIDYDFGLYSDPLTAPAGARDLQTASALVDGLPARWVRYALPEASAAAARICVGLHVPRVRSSSMGSIRFTALACVHHPADEALAKAVMATLRFSGPATP